VEDLLLASRSADIYGFMDLLLERNAPKALAVLSQLESQRVEPLLINTILTQQVRGLLKVKAAMGAGERGASRIAETTGLKEFVARKMVERARGFSVRELEAALSGCAAVNAALKSSRVSPYRILEEATLKILSLH